MMNYQQQYQASMETYEAMLQEFRDITENPRYGEIIETMPFEFLNAMHFYQSLSLYAEREHKPKMRFESAEDAVVFYKNLISFKKKIDYLLENASYLSEVGKIAMNINQFVSENPYLGKQFQVSFDEDVVKLARTCLTEIPKYPALMTKAFRNHYIESVIECLPMEQLAVFKNAGIMKSTDIDKINLTGDETYKAKIHYLCDLFDHAAPVIASYDVSLKGVTFPNDDGSSRQENLKELQEYAKTHPGEKISLKVEPYTFVPEIGDPEPAVRVLWGDKCIGNLAKDVARDIHEKYENPQLTGTLLEVSGGGNNMNFGCKMTFGIIAPGYHLMPVKDLEER